LSSLNVMAKETLETISITKDFNERPFPQMLK